MPNPKKIKSRSLRRAKQTNSVSLFSSLSSNSHSKELVEQLIMELQNKPICWEVLVSESLSSNSYPKELVEFLMELRNIVLDQLVREMTDNNYESVFSLITATLRQEEDTVIVNGQQVSIGDTHRGTDAVATTSSNLNIITRSPYRRREGVCQKSNEKIGCRVLDHIEEHMSSMGLEANIYESFQPLRHFLRNALSIRYCSSREIGDIDVNDQKDRNVEISANVVGGHLKVNVPRAEVDRIRRQHSYSSDASGAEVIVQCLEKELSDPFDLASLSFDYSGDDEEAHTLKRSHLKKVYRKKFGSYPTYRIRVNGVRWKAVCSSDDEADDENSCQETYRGSRRRKKAVKQHLNKHRSCDEGNSDNSGRDLVAVHTIFTKKKKLVKKLPKQDEEVDTTMSDASDTESLTDY